MPVIVPDGLPARNLLRKEGLPVFCRSESGRLSETASRVLLLNLMPTKSDTETQLTRMLSFAGFPVELTFMHTADHISANTPQEYLQKFYRVFDQLKADSFDGMIITGAPVELLDYEDVEYWHELCAIMDWTETHVRSTYHICWAAQAGLYHRYGIQKHTLPEKLFGVFPHTAAEDAPLYRGVRGTFYMPHSRHTNIRREDIAGTDGLSILAESPEAGVFSAADRGCKNIYTFGHGEYDADTLLREYRRDKAAGYPIAVPKHYFPNGDDTKAPENIWRETAKMIFTNWLTDFVRA